MTDADALVACLLEIERHIGRFGWDQPARLFALVPTADLIAAEPGLAPQLLGGRGEPLPGALSSIEQDGFPAGLDLLEALAAIAWPESVSGVALAVERAFLPADAESELPDDPDEAVLVLAQHPRRQDVRVVVGVLRDGARHGLARVRTEPGELVGGPDLVPGLAVALARTLD